MGQGCIVAGTDENDMSKNYLDSRTYALGGEHGIVWDRMENKILLDVILLSQTSKNC
jgi:hypothetical protein